LPGQADFRFFIFFLFPYFQRSSEWITRRPGFYQTFFTGRLGFRAPME
jgi:hypothetical protein